MITVVASTNRKNSKCLIFANKYAELLQEVGYPDVQVLALENIPTDWFFSEMYKPEKQLESLFELQDKYFRLVDKFVFVSSEYNGSIPGSLKLLIDAISVRELDATFKGKKAALVGLATGRAGNLRGMDHLSDILNHMGTIVLPNKLPISKISALLNEHKEVSDSATIETMRKQALEFINF